MMLVVDEWWGTGFGMERGCDCRSYSDGHWGLPCAKALRKVYQSHSSKLARQEQREEWRKANTRAKASEKIR